MKGFRPEMTDPLLPPSTSDGGRLTLVSAVIRELIRGGESLKRAPTFPVKGISSSFAVQKRCPHAVIEYFRFFEPRLFISLYRSRSSGQLGIFKKAFDSE